MNKVIKVFSLIITVSLLLSMGIYSSVAASFYYKDFELTFDSSNKSLYIERYNGSAEDISVPAEAYGYKVTGILNGAFKDCSTLKNVNIPITITYIGNYAFQNCTSLESVLLSNFVTSMGHSVFYGCTSLTTAKVFSPLDKLPNNTFTGCTSLTNVDLGYFVKEIGVGAFLNCTSLASLPIAKNVTAIDNYAFSNSGLQTIELYSDMESVPAYAFQNCSSLSEVVVPETVTSIGVSAFKNCSPNLVIKGYTQYVSDYCSENSIAFESAVPFFGNVNGDNYINIKDATFIQKSVVKISGFEIEKNTELFSRADVDGDGRVNIRDATLIAKFVVHKITKFPVEENT